MPTIAQTALADLEHEMSGTRKMLERYPTGHDEFTPHRKSGTLSKLATHIAEIPGLGSVVMEQPEYDFSKGTRPRPGPLSSAAALLEVFDASWGKLKASLGAASDESMRETWTLRNGDHVIMSMPRVAVMRALVANHSIHHRAQLTMYYRLLDVPVPGLYGPSADEP